jgi:histidinol-phosphatase (PHP family)
MIDCHVHTKRCNHGKGDLEDFIISAIGRGIKILGFSEHAPLSIDPGMRLTIRGAQKYTMDIERLKKAYKNELKILCGFEVDYFRPVEKETLDFIRNINADSLFGVLRKTSYYMGLSFIPG